MWCITGSGAGLRETVNVFSRIKEKFRVKITLCFSDWGFRVARIYGVVSNLHRIASGDYYEEWLVGEEGFYYVGRLNMGRYDLVVIAPATSNSVAKMVYGVADTLPTLVFSEALKSDTPVIIYPSDQPSRDGYLYSEAPCYVDTSLCKCLAIHGFCPASHVCPVNAFIYYRDFVRIDLGKCIGCELCIDRCIYNAIKCWETIRIKPRKIDLENIEKLKKLENICVVSDPGELSSVLEEMLG